MASQMNIVLGGGSGFIGKRLTTQLIGRGHNVTVVSRHPASQHLTWTDIQKIGLPPDCNAVVNLAGENIMNPLRRWNANFRTDIESSRIGTTQLLADAVNSMKVKPKVFLTTSAVAACRNHTHRCNSYGVGKLSSNQALVNYESLLSKHCVLSPCTMTSSQIPIVSSQLEQLRLDLSSVSQTKFPRQQILEYILPTTTSISTHKKILDPEIIHGGYKLPTYFNMVVEKLTPGLESHVPKVDPNVLQKPIIMHLMPYMLKIRRHKMKKHKLKKFRKRMIYVHRKLADIKERKKEHKQLEFERKWTKIAEDYDPEQFVDERLALARKGGYGKPLFSEKRIRRT